MKYINEEMIRSRMDMAGFSEEYINYIIGNLPPYYAIDIVKCKDCKHCEQSPITGNYICHNNRISIKGFLRAEIDFCSRGERKDSNE